MSQTLSERFAAFAHKLEYHDLPGEVIEKCKACLIHQIGIGFAGYQMDAPRIAAEIATASGAGGNPSATVIFNGYKVSVLEAAFANAALFHTRVQDDTHHTAHVGTVVISAALALAESGKNSGEELLTAMIAGYEISGALSKHYTSYTTPRGFRATCIYGIFGAAIAAARLLRLTEEQTAHALGIAAGFAFGTVESFGAGTMEFRFMNGLAARNGILSAMLAQHGVIASRHAFESSAGFLQAFVGNREQPLRASLELGNIYEIMNVTFKPYPVCAFNQTQVINARKMAEESEIPIELIESVLIEMNAYEAKHPGITDTSSLSNVTQTLMSTPYAVALSLLKREVTMENIQLYDDPDINRLMGKTKVVGSEAIKPLCSRIHVTLSDGRAFNRVMEITPSYYSLNVEEEIALVQNLIGEMPVDLPRLQQINEQIVRIEQLTDVSDWLSSLAL